jgi:hypothetical protein
MRCRIQLPGLKAHFHATVLPVGAAKSRTLTRLKKDDQVQVRPSQWLVGGEIQCFNLDNLKVLDGMI